MLGGIFFRHDSHDVQDLSLHRTQNTEHRTQNTEHRTLNTEY